ncbi:MAG TPA: M23 family metallopeptidase [Caldilineae bacterium]|nr:M23 family metallopeptidase [Caldilineae bacterium]
MTTPKVRLPFDDDQRLTQGFGERPELYRARFGLPGHNGIDWGLPIGTPILAVDAGKVIVRHTSATGFGRYIKLQHSWGQSLYAHLSEFQVSIGDEVERGQRVGFSGNSGFSTGPHLHFGMRINPYSKSDGWYGYTNPHRFIDWLPREEDAARDQEESKEVETPVTGVSISTSSMAQLEDELAHIERAFAFELQEYKQQADLWQESVMKVLMQHLPGELPPSADILASLETLMDAWAQELDQQRAAAITAHFAPSEHQN